MLFRPDNEGVGADFDIANRERPNRPTESFCRPSDDETSPVARLLRIELKTSTSQQNQPSSNASKMLHKVLNKFGPCQHSLDSSHHSEPSLRVRQNICREHLPCAAWAITANLNDCVDLTHEIGCIGLDFPFCVNGKNFVSTVTTHKTMTATGTVSSLQGSRHGISLIFASIVPTHRQ